MNETTEEDYSDEYNFTCDPEDMDRYYNMTAWRAACSGRSTRCHAA